MPSDKLRWKQVQTEEDVLGLKGRQNVDFVLLATQVWGNATIIYFADKTVEERLKPLLQGSVQAEHAGLAGVRVEQPIAEVKHYLSSLPGLVEVN